MRLCQVLLFFIVVLAVPSDGISTDSKQIKMSMLPSLDAPPDQVKVQNTPNQFLTGVEEERGVTVTGAVGTIASAIMKKGEMKLYLSLGLKPERVMKLLKVKSREGESFKRYSKYFFRYYVKYLDAPTSHLPASTVHDIMKARLYSWLDDLLTPPQVFAKLGLTGPWDLARGQKNYDYFDWYRGMYGDLQVRKSKDILGLEEYNKFIRWMREKE